MFGINPANYREISQTLARFVLIDQAIIYGSRARGSEHEGSDIDLTLLGEGLSFANTIAPLAEAIDELYLPYSFDLSIFAQLSHAGMIADINRDGKIFYQKS